MTSLIKKINEIHNNNNLSLVTDLIKKHFNEIKYIDTELIIVIKDSFIDIFEKNKIIQIIEIFKDIECNFDKKEDFNCAILCAEKGEHTLQEIGDIFGITRMRVCQMEKIILKYLFTRKVIKKS